MSHHKFKGRVLDARPDRIDFRDRPYQPPLVSLPPSFPSEVEIADFLPKYAKTSKILDQGKEGACTGFGLAAVINYTVWDRWLRENNGDDTSADLPPHVSPWMLYENARVYDEWEGEDYAGSSCRGAMKGWHKHGACGESLWLKPTRTNPRPELQWRSDAALRPLGAYYRVKATSIADMQAAIREVRAVYCSARVHEGWWLGRGTPKVTVASLKIPVIKPHPMVTGGHAFAVVGYTSDGFIIQNSWGHSWGTDGFALVTYEDWAKNGDDAWVAAIAAPMATSRSAVNSSAVSNQALSNSILGQPATSGNSVGPWTEEKAYEHSVVMGNDGKLLRRLVDTADAADNLKKVVNDLPQIAFKNGVKHIVFYAHGGLNSEQAAIARARKLGPWFEANGIYPVFMVWRTSLLESIGQIGLDLVSDFMIERDEMLTEGLDDLLREAKRKLQNKFDNAFEAAAEKVVGKAVWSQMKQNAHAAANGKGATRQITTSLQNLLSSFPEVTVNFLGHSAGSILLGHMLDDMSEEENINTVRLYAPACSMEFAVKHYGRALNNNVIKKGALTVDNLSEENERDDTVGPYGKSLLYLVSRSLEEPRKTPLLGFEKAWNSTGESLSDLKDQFGADFALNQIKYMQQWESLISTHDIVLNIETSKEIETKNKPAKQYIKATHGSFDNSLKIVNSSIAQILGKDKPVKPATDLSGF